MSQTFIAVADHDGLRQLYPTSELCAGIAPLSLSAMTDPLKPCVAEVRLESAQADVLTAHLVRHRRRTALRLLHEYTRREALVIVGTRAGWESLLTLVN